MDRTITVSGRATTTVAPDIARLRCGVRVLAERAADALHRSNAAMQAILDAAIAAGVGRNDLATSGPRLRRTDRGYEGVDDVTVAIRDLTTVGAIVDAVVADGGPDVTMQGVTFDLVERDGHLPSLRADAMRDARTTAQQLASADGATVGDVVRIVDESSTHHAPPIAFRAAASASTPVEAGEQELGVAVTVTYALV